MKPFSVIIPTTGDSPVLATVIEALRKQGRDLVEQIIVVYDAKMADPAFAASHPDVMCLATGAPRGPSAARNAGAKQALAGTLVFLDDDVIPGDGALQALFRCVQRAGERAAFVGRVVPDPSVPDNCYLRLGYSGIAHFRPGMETTRPLYWFFNTSFTCVPKRVFDEQGGFNEKLRGMEDAEFAFRMKEAGVSLEVCADAVGLHVRSMDRSWLMFRGEATGPWLRELLAVQPRMKMRGHRLLDHLVMLGPVFAAGWRFLTIFLPIVERMPYALSVPFLRLAHAFGVAAGYTRRKA